MAQAFEALERLASDPETVRLARNRLHEIKLNQMFRDEGIREGEARGKLEGKLDDIEHLCSKLDIEITKARRSQLQAPDADLRGTLDSVARQHRWPD